MSKRRLRISRFEPNRKFRRSEKMDYPNLVAEALAELGLELDDAAASDALVSSLSVDAACASSAQVR